MRRISPRSARAPAVWSTISSICSPPTIRRFVHFIEARGRGISLRAAPIDVAAIVRDAVLGGREATRAHVGDARRGCVVRLRARPTRRAGCRDAAAAVRVRLPHATRCCICRRTCPTRDRRTSTARPPGSSPSCSIARSGRAFVLFTSYAAHARRARAGSTGGCRWPLLVQGTAPAHGAPARLPRHAECGAARHGQLLAGRGRRRRGAELRHRRSAAVRVARRSAGGGADRRRSPRAAATRSASIRCRWRRSRCCRASGG